MILASLSFSGTDWLWPAAACLVAAASFVILSYARSSARPGVRAACAALKLAGIGALVLCVLEPIWTHPRAKPGANFFVVLADNSQGLQVKDRASAKTRGEMLKEKLAHAPWLDSLADTFSLRRFTFGSRLQNVETFESLDFTGTSSGLGKALGSIAERYRGQPLAGVLVFSDGNATDIQGTFDTSGVPPVFPVVIGREEPERDISLSKVTVTQTAFEDAPVTVQADINANGYGGDDITVQLLDRSGSIIETQNLKAEKPDAPLSARFLVKAPRHGLSFYTVRTAAKAEMGAFNDAKTSREATLANNSRAVAVNQGRGAHRILYVSGRPNWEFKFLNRALADDGEVQLVGLIRIAKREPKFEFIGRRGETGNPLFRGFDRKDEDVERYDQPVIVRLNTRDELELKGGFPKTAEDLYSYEAVIVDDIESQFFTRDQMMLVQKFVSERGGGVLMLGGSESFHEGSYARTPIGDMLPVYLDTGAAPEPRGALKLVLTREGWLQPWLRLRDTEGDERTRIESMPGFDILNASRAVKPGASVLASVTDSKSAAHPALVAQRFGNGRTAALLVGDLWHWGLRDEPQHKDMDKAWRQMIRWLTTDVPAPIELTVDEGASADSVPLKVIARDRKFQPLDNATVQLLVTYIGTGNETNSVRLTAEAAPTAAGVYTATYIPRHSGAYRAEAIVVDANGAEAGRAETGWTSDPAADEFRSLKPNRALLEQIARQTGGEIVSDDGLQKFVSSLPNRKAPIMEPASQPLWHTPAMFMFALVCFAGEWGVRRWKGLP